MAKPNVSGSRFLSHVTRILFIALTTW